MKIRPMRHEDIVEALAVVSDCWGQHRAQLAEPEFRSAFADGPYQPFFYVADIGGKIAGTGFFRASWLNYGIYEMGWLCVSSKHRRVGVASALVERRIEDIEKLGRLVLISTHIPDFFLRWGFRPVYASASIDESETTLMTLDIINKPTGEK